MGKRRRLNRLISKWIKSDLPDDRSTVLLLGVTRRKSPAPSPLRIRRPFSIPLALGAVPDLSRGGQVRRNSSASSRTRPPLVRRKSSRRSTDDPPSCQLQLDIPTVVVTAPPSEINQPDFSTISSERSLVTPEVRYTPSHSSKVTSEASDCPARASDWLDCQKTKESGVHAHCVTRGVLAKPCMPTLRKNDKETLLICNDFAKRMDSSVDSIGACSIDMEASVTMSDWSEASSDGTLRSVSIISTPVDKQQHLPSYLSLACTVNGYSTTTNYDPIRLAKSRDASPNRPQSEHLTGQRMYSVTNNLLSPPNLVPLPTHNGNSATMAENILRQHRHHEEFYRSTKTMTYISKESNFSSNMFVGKDNIDGCIENNSETIQNKFVKFESSNLSPIPNNQSKTTYESTVKKEYSNGKETKSFIQQRVERLYGPGALAQGFFVSKRQQNRLSISDEQESPPRPDIEKHSKSLTDKLWLDDEEEPSMKSSNSRSPALPVLRHLRPEFRAQLPIISLRKSTEATCSMQKSVTVPKLKDEVKLNGHSKEEKVETDMKAAQNGIAMAALVIDEESGTKDGHYFLKIIEEQSARLLRLADETEKNLENADLSDEVVGIIRSAAGKARLLVSQKIQQFRGLCVNNITQSAGEAFPTTNEDLQGFWDMVMLQVDQVDKLFEDIEKLRKNDWKEVAVKKEPAKQNGTSKPRKVVAKPKPSAASEEARKQREEQRKKMIEERRKAMKASQQQQQQSKNGSSIEIFVSESS